MNRNSLCQIFSKIKEHGIQFEPVLGAPVIEPTLKEELLSIIKADPELEIFNGKFINYGIGDTRVEFNDLLQWLLVKVAYQGVEDTLNDLERYLKLPESQGYEVLAISGITVSAPIDLSDGLRLVSFSDIPNGVAKAGFSRLEERLAEIPPPMNLSRMYVDAALIRSITFKPKVLLPSESQTNRQEISKVTELLETSLSFTLIEKSSPIPILYWMQLADWMPCSSKAALAGIKPINDVLPPYRLTSTRIAPDKAKQIYNKFSTLEQDVKAQLRVPLERLNQSRRRNRDIDKAIELGIALEGLLLKDSEKDKLTKLFIQRGTWMLGPYPSTGEENKTKKVFDDLYELRSQAVHQGKIKIDLRYESKKTPDEILENGDMFCVKIIEKIVEKGRFPRADEWLSNSGFL